MEHTLVHYTRITAKGSRLQVQALVEVDRATMPVPRLASKLGAYARYYDYAPLPKGQRSAAKRAAQLAWRTRYPKWPRVLVVLDGDQRQLQERRRVDLALYASTMMHLAHRPGFHISAATMHDLKEQGPHEPIWLNLLRPGLVQVPGSRSSPDLTWNDTHKSRHGTRDHEGV